MYHAYLMHHGVKGQRWGVRRYQNYDGTWIKKAGIGSAKRVRQKQQYFKDKIAKSDSNPIMRNTINDWRRGRVSELEAKARHREAKNRYRHTKSNEAKTDLRIARLNRINKNVLAPTAGSLIGVEGSTGTYARGRYNRYRQNGKSRTKSMLNAAGPVLLSTAASAVALNIGKNYLKAKIMSQYGVQV